MSHRFSIGVIAGIALLLTSCNVNVNEGNGTDPHGNVMNADSGTTVTTHSETHTESNTSFEVKGGVHSESHSTTHTTTTVGKSLPFPQQVDQWVAEIFPDYKVVELDPMDAYPQYKGSQQTIFKRLRMKNPISNSYGKSVYPRILIKAYRFIAPSALTKDVEGWLNSLGSTTKGIELGQEGVSVKSPPHLCAVVGNDFLVVQSGFVYEGPEWTASKQLFVEKMQAQNAAYVFEIHCDGGKITYTLQGN